MTREILPSSGWGRSLTSFTMAPQSLSFRKPAVLTPAEEQKLITFAHTLVDQKKACVIVEPQDRASGFWFGGGNTIEDKDGSLYVVGRYRNAGDSRTGVAAGERGLELAIFRSSDRGDSWKKVVSFFQSRN